MPGQSPVGSWALTNFTSDLGSTFKGKIDANFAVAQRTADYFAPKPNSPASMTVIVDAGFVDAVTPAGMQVITEVAAQTLTISAAPASPNNRIDLIVVDAGTGTASVITGTPAGTPTAPAIPVGRRQIAQVSVPNGTSSIAAANITDLRAVWGQFARGTPFCIASGSADALTGTFTPATPTLGAAYDGYIWRVRAAAANATTTPTFKADANSAYTIKKWNAQALAAGDIAGAGHELVLAFNYNGGSPYLSLLNPQPAALPTDLVKTDVKAQSFTGGFRPTSYSIGTMSSGTLTPDPGNGPLQFLTNDGAFTIAAPAYDGAMDILIANGSTAGAITMSGFYTAN